MGIRIQSTLSTLVYTYLNQYHWLYSSKRDFERRSLWRRRNMNNYAKRKGIRNVSVSDAVEPRRNHRSYQVVMYRTGSIESQSVRIITKEMTRCLPMDSDHS